MVDVIDLSTYKYKPVIDDFDFISHIQRVKDLEVRSSLIGLYSDHPLFPQMLADLQSLDYEMVLYTAHTYDWSPGDDFINQYVRIANRLGITSHFVNLWAAPFTLDRRILLGSPRLTDSRYAISTIPPASLDFTRFGIPVTIPKPAKRVSRYYTYLDFLGCDLRYLLRALDYYHSNYGLRPFEAIIGVPYTLTGHYRAITVAAICIVLSSYNKSFSSFCLSEHGQDTSVVNTSTLSRSVRVKQKKVKKCGGRSPIFRSGSSSPT